MFCENCGKKLEEGSRFCNNCGTAVDVAIINDTAAQISPVVEPEVVQPPVVQPVYIQQPAVEQPIYQQAPQQPYVQTGYVQAPPEPPKKSNKKPIIIAIIVAAVILFLGSCCCCGGLYIIGSEVSKVENVAKDYAQIELEAKYGYDVEITDAYRLDDDWDDDLEAMMKEYGYDENDVDDYCFVMIEATVDGEDEEFIVFCIERDDEWLAKELVDSDDLQ